MQRSARFRVFRKIFRAGLRPPPEGSKLSNVAIALQRASNSQILIYLIFRFHVLPYLIFYYLILAWT